MLGFYAAERKGLSGDRMFVLTYPEMNIVIVCVELKKGKPEGRSEVRERKNMGEKEWEGKKEK